MIFYGTNGTHLRTAALSQLDCPSCGTNVDLKVSLFSRYVHVYWIPFFPYTKLAVVQCGHCQMAWENKALPPSLAPAVRELKQQTQQPFWTWAGVALVLSVMVFGYLHSIRDTHTDEILLANPRAGDIYTVRTDSANMYSLLKVRQVSGNSVELVANEYQSSDSTPIETLNAPAKYSNEPFVLTRLDLQIMRRKGELTDVDRLSE